jgi:tetratricopeptide (TPR) repeat protein
MLRLSVALALTSFFGPAAADAAARAAAASRLAEAALQAQEAGAAAQAAALAEEGVRAAARSPGADKASLSTALRVRGVIRHWSGDESGAEADLSALRAAAPVTPGLLVETARLLQAMSRNAEAADVASAALRLKPELPEALLVQSRAFLELGRGEEAIACALAVSKLRPASAQAFLHLGRAYRRLGRFEEARAALQRALSLSPRDQRSLDENGYLSLFKDGPRRGAAFFRRSVEASPGSPMAHHHYAAFLEFTGRRRQAVREYEEALRLHRLAGATRGSDYAHTLINLAAAYSWEGGRGEEQASCLRAAAAATPSGSPLWATATANLAILDGARGRRDSARKRLREALRFCAGHPCLGTGRGELTLAAAVLARQRGDVAAAASSAREAQGTLGAPEASPEATAFFATALGTLFMDLGDQARAEEVLSLALAAARPFPFHPITAGVHHALSRLRKSQGNESASAAHEKAAADINATLRVAVAGPASESERSP